ncbi:dienelactone hydrolase family protein [Pendulispora rubella]|uniref:Dienelactone hydrolase family protein n=1 Tax=Pendulispora rubella TaxID=2741070 RepID=A0ABZ2LHE1_9BACT
MTTRVEFAGKNGETVKGDLALPEGSAKAPAVIVLQEWWGVNDHIRSIATRLASAGFLAIAPDLYDGEEVPLTNEARASERMDGLDWGRAISQIAAAVAYAKSHPRSTGKVGVTGFCMGGALSFVTATQLEGLSAVVPFYGIPPKAEYAKVTAPILTHVAKHDQWVTPEKADAVKRELESHGKSIELHVYDADHAFFNDTRAKVYSAENAKVAWDRTIAFLKKHLA